MAQTHVPSFSNLIIIVFFFFTITPFSLQVSASVYKRLQLVSKEITLPATSTSSPVLSLSLYPHSSIVKPPYKNYSDLVISRRAADKARVNFINSKLHRALSNFNRPDLQPEDLETPLIGSNPMGEYLARIGVGQPSKDFYLIADTGSHINWLQCLPCSPCFEQPGPIFNPSESSSYRVLSCTSQQCPSVESTGCNGTTCKYIVPYGDNSITTGELATETMAFGSSISVDKVVIGCGRMNQGDFAGAAGILGLGGTVIGLPSQLKATSFSYCLVDPGSNSSSTLEFNSAPPSDSVLVPFIINPKINIYYYVELAGIIVGGELIPIPASVYQIGQNGDGGIILDSGTTVTALPTQIYNSVRDTFVKYAKNLPPPSNFSDFETCYDLSSAPDGSIPTMSFQFSGGQTLPLKKKNYLTGVDDSGKIFCLAFDITSQNVSIIGNIQQQGMRVTYDLANNLIGFSANKC